MVEQPPRRHKALCSSPALERRETETDTENVQPQLQSPVLAAVLAAGVQCFDSSDFSEKKLIPSLSVAGKSGRLELEAAGPIISRKGYEEEGK